jgi:hypothetical protein
MRLLLKAVPTSDTAMIAIPIIIADLRVLSANSPANRLTNKSEMAGVLITIPFEALDNPIDCP